MTAMALIMPLFHGSYGQVTGFLLYFLNLFLFLEGLIDVLLFFDYLVGGHWFSNQV